MKLSVGRLGAQGKRAVERLERGRRVDARAQEALQKPHHHGGFALRRLAAAHAVGKQQAERAVFQLKLARAVAADALAALGPQGKAELIGVHRRGGRGGGERPVRRALQQL